MIDTTATPEATEAYQALVAQVGRKSPTIPPGVLALHVMDVVPPEEWPTRVAAMDALLRRLDSARRDELRIVSRPEGPPRPRALRDPPQGARSVRPYRTHPHRRRSDRRPLRLPRLPQELARPLQAPPHRPRNHLRSTPTAQAGPTEQEAHAEPIRDRAVLGPDPPLDRRRRLARSRPLARRACPEGQPLQAACPRPQAVPTAPELAGSSSARLTPTIPPKRLAARRGPARPPARRLRRRLARPGVARLAQRRARAARACRAAGPLLRGGPLRAEGLEADALSLPARGRRSVPGRAAGCCWPTTWAWARRRRRSPAPRSSGRTGRVRRGLVIAPASLKPQWAREWAAFSDLPVHIVEGTPSERHAIYDVTHRRALHHQL